MLPSERREEKRETERERDEGIKSKTSNQINQNCFTRWKGDASSNRGTARVPQEGGTRRTTEDHTGLRECTEKGLHAVLQVLLDLWRCCHSCTVAIISGKLIKPLCACPAKVTRTQGNSLLATRNQGAREGLKTTSQVQLRGATTWENFEKM